MVLNNLLNAIDAPQDEDLNRDGDFADPGERATLEEQQARTNLIATIVGGIAEAADLDTPSATLAAAIETQNNELVLPDGSSTQIGSRSAYMSISQLREKDASFNAAINRAAEMAGIDAGTLEKAYIAYVECKGAPADVCNTPAIEFFDAIAALYDATDKYWQEKDEFLDANCGQGLVLTCGINSTDSFLESPDGTRVKGAFDTVLGGAGVVLGGVTTITSGIACPASGVGCLAAPVAAAGTAASADQAYTGYQMLITGEPQNTLGAQWLADNTDLSLEEAEQAYAIATILVSVGEVGVLSRLSKAKGAVSLDNPDDPRLLAKNRGAIVDDASIPGHGAIAPTRAGVIDEGKFDYLFGQVTSNPHNMSRSQQLQSELSHISIYDTADGRCILTNHLNDVASDSSSIVRTFSENRDGVTQNFTVRESLLKGPGGFIRLETTFETMADGTSRFITTIPYRLRE